LNSGNFEGELACPLTQVEATYETGNASAVRELSFSVEQGAEQLVEELLDSASAASQAVATSFLDAMRLPERANVQVVHAELQRRRLTHERRLQQAIAVDIAISGVSATDIQSLDNALDTHDATSTVSAHLEQNLAQVEGIDIGSVSGVGMQPLPEDPTTAATPSSYTGFLEPEDGGCAQWTQWSRLFAIAFALRVLL
jgi:hypothetical protein